MQLISSNTLARVTQQALLAGGAIIKSGFFQKRRVQFKSPTSPVTHIDLKSEKKIISLIRRTFPTHDFLAEESDYLRTREGKPMASRNPKNGYRWIIDPLDGTVNFLHGIPQCCVTIGVEHNNRVVVGGVYDPFRNELFLAVKGKGAFLNGKRIRVSDKKTLNRSLLMTGFPYDHRERAAYYLKIAKPFLETAMDLRRFGSAALDLAWIASGRIEGYWEFNLNPWDVAGGELLVKEAGGKVSDFSGRRLNVNDPRQILATNRFIHVEMLHIFRNTLGFK